MKAQSIRLADVFFIGPMMIWFSKAEDFPQIAQSVMMALGVATMLYNGLNYLEIRKKES